MADILPRNIIISMLLVFFIFTSGIYVITETYDGIGVTAPDQLNQLESNLTGSKTAIEEFADSQKDAYNSESESGFVSGACTSLLGDDNFFCAGLQTLGAFTKAPENFRLTIDAFNQNSLITIPSLVLTTLTTILVTIIVFVSVSAYRRYKS